MVRRGVLALALVLGCLSTVALGSTANAAACRVLQPADLRYGAPNLSGPTTTDAAQADCYQVPSLAGSVYQTTTSSSDVMIRFLDANGATACGPPSDSDTCRLSGAAPFTMRVHSSQFAPPTYEAHVFRLDGFDACPAGAVTPFGETSPSLRIAPSEPWKACRSLDLDSGNHLVLPDLGDGRNWVVVGSDGGLVCREYLDGGYDPICRVPAAGSYRLLQDHRSDSDPARPFEMSVTALRSSQGCQAPIDTSWTSAAVAQQLSSSVQVDCRPVSAAAGDRVGMGGSYPSTETLGAWNRVEMEIVDAAGLLACRENAEPGYGCLLEGQPPYRMVSWTHPEESFAPGDAYRFAVRSLDPLVGCPLVRRSAFNTPVDQLNRGTGCWQYDAAAGLPFQAVVGRVTASGIDAGARPYGPYTRGAVLDPRFVPLCTNGGCNPTVAGRHTVVTSVLGGDYVLGVYQRQDSSGCRPLEADLTTIRGAVDGAQFLCLSLDLDPGHSAALVLTGPNGKDVAFPAAWYNAAGENICPYDYALVSYCSARGPGPYHVVIGDGVAFDYQISALDYVASASLQPPGQCIDLGVGAPVEVRLDASTSTVCLAAGHEGSTEQITIDRVSGAGRFQSFLLLGRRQYCGGTTYFVSQLTFECASYYTTGGRRAIVITGDGGVATLSVSRTVTSPAPPPEPEPVPLRNQLRPTLHGRPLVGRTLLARPGSWTPAATGYHYVWHVAGKRLPGTTSRRLKLLSKYRGKRITVAVVAVRAGSDPGVAFSQPVTVRRRR